MFTPLGSVLLNRTMKIGCFVRFFFNRGLLLWGGHSCTLSYIREFLDCFEDIKVTCMQIGYNGGSRALVCIRFTGLSIGNCTIGAINNWNLGDAYGKNCTFRGLVRGGQFGYIGLGLTYFYYRYSNGIITGGGRTCLICGLKSGKIGLAKRG